MKKISLIASLVALFMVGCAPASSERAIPADAQIEKNVKRTLSTMTLKDKAGQMVQLTCDLILDPATKDVNVDALNRILTDYRIGSFLNVPFGQAQSREKTAQIITSIQDASMEIMGIPCLYGLDQIHGATYIKDATFFPQEINIGASFNPEYARAMGEILAYETRASMVPWVFSPVMDLGRDPRWPRQWESWGEDPYLQSVMASTETSAAQGNDPNHVDFEHVGVSLKHYMAYGVPFTGKDRTPAVVTASDLKEKFFAPFKASAQVGGLSVMANSAAINGVPTHANKELLTGWLKEGLSWDGMIVTDWADINNLYTRDHLACDKKDALRIGINAGIDMVMEPYDPTAVDLIVELAEEGLIPMSRIDDAVSRILRIKYRLGLFDNPTWDITGYDRFGCDEFVAKARSAATESEVLLKNEGILPIAKGARILVAGPNGDHMRAMNGGWSYTWQGSADPVFHSSYNTFFEALSDEFGSENVRYVPGVSYDNNADWSVDYFDRISEAESLARWADVIIACIGENSYCETPGNLSDLTLSDKQLELVRRLSASGKPLVLVLNEGRPRIISSIEPLADAVIDVMVPGNYGGDALAMLISGRENFSGKLPYTYPKYVHSLHTYDYKVSENVSTMAGEYNYDAVMDVQWPFGYGLSYTTFEYSNLNAEISSFSSSDILAFTVDVTNTGGREGKESVLLYSSDIVASLIPDVKRLRAFDKVSLMPGETKTLRFEVPATSLGFVLPDGRWTLEEGDFRISVGGLSAMVRCTETSFWN